MNSYINLIMDAEGAKERLRQLFRSAPEPVPNDQSPPSIAVRRQRRKRRRWARSRTMAPSEGPGHDAAGAGLATHSGAVRIEAIVLIASCVLTILGLIKAACSEAPLLWIAVWPAPVVLGSTVFIFCRQGFHFQNGVFVLGRRPR